MEDIDFFDFSQESYSCPSTPIKNNNNNNENDHQLLSVSQVSPIAAFNLNPINCKKVADIVINENKINNFIPNISNIKNDCNNNTDINNNNQINNDIIYKNNNNNNNNNNCDDDCDDDDEQDDYIFFNNSNNNNLNQSINHFGQYYYAQTIISQSGYYTIFLNDEMLKQMKKNSKKEIQGYSEQIRITNETKIKIQCEIYGFYRLLTSVPKNVKINSIYEFLENEFKYNYNLNIKISYINNENHIQISSNSIVEEVLKQYSQIYLFVSFLN